MGNRLNRDAILWTGLVAIVTGFASPVDCAERSTPSQNPLPENVREWIRDLGSDSFATRETATRRLTDAGAPVIRAVSAAAINRDLEVARRAQVILKRIVLSDDTGMEVLLEVERTAPPRVAECVSRILDIPTVQLRFKLFCNHKKKQSEAELILARRDVMTGRSDSAWRRVRKVQVLDEKYNLFGYPNPILAVIASLEVESSDKKLKSGRILNRSEKVYALMIQTRTDLSEGRLEEALHFATVANRIGSSLARGAEPMLFAEIDATKLLRSAREDIRDGRADAAREKMLQALEEDRKYGLFAKAIHPQTRALFILFRANDSEDDLRLLNSKPQDLASELLRSARADLDAQRIKEARSKALAAQALGIDDSAELFIKAFDDKIVAQRLLEISREFANEGDLKQAKNWLAHIIRVYPTTEASTEAAQMLKSLP